MLVEWIRTAFIYLIELFVCCANETMNWTARCDSGKVYIYISATHYITFLAYTENDTVTR